jgi:hypothetical protein
MTTSCISLCQVYIYIYIHNTGAMTVNIEFMWRGLETGERQALVRLSIRFVPS